MTALADLIAAGIRVEAHRPWPRALVGAELWNAATNALADGALTLVGLWGDDGTVQMALSEGEDFAVISLDCPSGRFPSVGKLHPPAIRLERTIADLYGLVPDGAEDRRPWLDHGRWGITHPLGEASPASASPPALRLPAGRRRKPASDSGRTGACGDHRAGAFPLHRQRRDGGAAGGAARLRAQGHRRADARR